MKDNLVTGQSFIICKEEGEFKTMMNKNIHFRAVVYRPHFHQTVEEKEDVTDTAGMSNDQVSEDSVEDESTGRPPPDKQKMDTNSKPWLKDIRKSGNKTLFGKTGIQIRLPSSRNNNGQSNTKKRTNLIESSDDTDDTVTYDEEKNLAKKDESKKSAGIRRNSSSASTECEAIVTTAPTKKNKQIRKKKTRIKSSDDESSSESEDVEETKNKVNKKKTLSVKASSKIIHISSETTETDDAVHLVRGDKGKRKRQLSGPSDTHSKMSSSKKLKSIQEESTEDSSETKWVTLKNNSKSNNLTHKRKSGDIDHSSSSESEIMKKRKSQKKSGSKKKSNAMTPELTLKFSSSEEELPPLVRPRKRHSSDSSTRSTQSNASTVAYSHSQVKGEQMESSFPIHDPEYQNISSGIESEDSGADSDTPLKLIMIKRNSSTETKQSNNSDENESELLFSQIPIKEQGRKDTEEMSRKERAFSSYTQEEDEIFVIDSDEDFYSSMSQQNLTIDYNDKPDAENDEDERVGFFLDGEDDVDTIHVKIESPELPLDFDWLKEKVEAREGSKDQYDINTQVITSVKVENVEKDNYDADTQIISDDSDEDFFEAATQIPNENTTGIEVQDEDDTGSETEDYYHAQTQLPVDNIKNGSSKEEKVRLADTEKAVEDFYNASTQHPVDNFKKRSSREEKVRSVDMVDTKKAVEDFYNVDTQVAVIDCDEFDSDDNDLFQAETQISGIKEEGSTSYDRTSKKVKEEMDKDSNSLDYYNAQTQVFDETEKKLPIRRKSFDLDNFDEQLEEGKKSQINRKRGFKESKPERVIKRESKDLYDANTQIDRTNKHSVVQRLSDEGCVVEHIKETKVIVKKQFSTPLEAQKYLKEYNSSEDLYGDDTQEYDWPKGNKPTIKKKPVYSDINQDDTKVVADVYDINTQIDRTKNEAIQEFDPYAAATQVVKPEVIDISDDENDNVLYNCATQVESKLEAKERAVSEVKDKKLKNSILSSGIQQITSKVSVGVPKNVMDAMSQMEFKSENHCNIYDMATQVQNHDENETESDQEIYAAATQFEISCDETSKTKDNYNAQTLGDDVDEDSQNCYNEMTQVETPQKQSKKEARNVFNTMTQVDNTVDVCEAFDPYTAQTQGDNVQMLSSEDEIYEQATQVDLTVPVSNEEDSWKSDDDESKQEDNNGEYVAMLDDEADENVNEKPEDRSVSPVEINDGYIAMLDEVDEAPQPVTITDSTLVSKSKENKTPKKDKTYVKHTMLKKVSSEEKKTMECSPKKPKTSKEKRESFQLEKERFYSQKPSKKADSKSPEMNHDIDIVEDHTSQWLSKQQKSKEMDKVKKHRETKPYSAADNSLDGNIRAAKNKLAERGMKQAEHPQPVKRKHLFVEGASDVSDVTLPDEKEILAKQLPLLEFPRAKGTQSSQENQQTTKEKQKKDTVTSEKTDKSNRGDNRSHSQSDRHDRSSSKHKHHHSSSQSSGHRKERHSKDKDQRDKRSGDKDQKSHDKREESHDKKKDHRSSSKSSTRKDEKSSEKSISSEKSREKESSRRSSGKSSHRTSSHKEKNESSKKNETKKDDKDKTIMKRIPKLSETAKKEKENETVTKSPLLATNLDSQISGDFMSKIGLSSMKITSRVRTRSREESEQRTETLMEASTSEVSLKNNSPEKCQRLTISMYRERDLEFTSTGNLETTSPAETGEKTPKSILRIVGSESKGLKVQFRTQPYSQSAENTQRGVDWDNRKARFNTHFPNGLPKLPGENENEPVTQPPVTSSVNLMKKLPLNLQAAKAKPLTTQNQNSTITYQPPPGAFTSTSQQIPVATVPTPSSYQQHRNRAAPCNNSRPSSAQQQVDRVPVPIFKQGSSPIADLSILDFNYFFVKILKWNANWFDEYEKHQTAPPDVEEAYHVSHLLDSYDSYEDYFKTLFPHLYLETWETCVRSWQESKGRRRSVDIVFTRVHKPCDKMFTYTFTAVVPKQTFNLLNEGDLVIVNTWGVNAWEVSAKHKAKYYPQLGFIERLQYRRNQGDVVKILQTFPSLVKEGKSASDLIGLEIIVKTRFRQFKMLPDKRSSITVVCSLVSTIRHYNALSRLYKTTMVNSILTPGILRVFHNHPSVRENDLLGLDKYNKSQQKAIVISTKIALEPAQQNRVVLIQGPPGTGKSYTIIGIIKNIIKKSNRACHICLCAPSNAAVDELMKRLIDERRKMEEKSKHSGFRLVRIGKPENIHHDVQKYTYREIVKVNQAEELKNKIKRQVNTSVVKEIDKLKTRISSLQEELTNKMIKMQTIEAGKIRSEINKLEKKKDDMEVAIQAQYKDIKLTRQEEQKVMRDVLIKSHIVCGTLNSFGNDYYADILAPYYQNSRRSMFNCIIVDEASQATELDTLIPLQYGTTKLIMVGDPEQLPPTVLSQKSAQKSFGQSLFERFYNHFRHEDVNPVLFLDTQYRMHPEIAHFPSKFVYLGALKTDSSVEERCNIFQLKPYLLFDMQEGQEHSTQRGAIINSTEAEFTIELCEFLMSRTRLQQQQIGIIAPYQQQKKIIKEGLESRKLISIEVNTVDSFQGREKEVIILSCTRAKNVSGGIGFLANSKRMNVALTRAKTALYVVGCLSSLKRGDLAWRNLIEDAERRNVIRKITEGRYDMVFNGCLNISARLGRLFVT
ncbi:probable helicase senataxin isoform X2 [Mytilus californianus]|uniref:probable helicase senataxin isoform X2 n=1 Tax=Mytilus californianus TaxID=6549 RepID=UPI00224745FF|nr:probable helicase senataxin isoform X2 [Mytilus californianus]